MTLRFGSLVVIQVQVRQPATFTEKLRRVLKRDKKKAKSCVSVCRPLTVKSGERIFIMGTWFLDFPGWLSTAPPNDLKSNRFSC